MEGVFSIVEGVLKPVEVVSGCVSRVVKGVFRLVQGRACSGL